MTRNQTKEKIKNPYANMEKINHEELLLEKPIKIQKRKKKAKVENESIEEDSEEIRNEPRPSKKIKKDIKEKILLLKNKAKGYHFSGNSSEESLDEINYPILPNRSL